MDINIFKMLFSHKTKTKQIQRPGDLNPQGVKYTIKGNYSFNETFENIYQERLNKVKI
jgi:hypothetical protein